MKNTKQHLCSSICQKSNDNAEDCTHYYPESNFRFRYQNFESGKTYKTFFLRYDSFIMIQCGQIELTINDQKCLLSDGDIMVLPLFSVISFKALTDVKVFSFVYMIDRYHQCMIRKLKSSWKASPEDPLRLPVPLRSTQALTAFTSSLRFLIDRVPDCHQLYQNKGFELGMYRYSDYDTKTLLEFLHPLFRMDYDFVVNINAGLDYCCNINEMSEWVNMDIPSFKEHFKKVFQEEAEVWIERNRKSLFLSYVINHICSVSELMRKFSCLNEEHLNMYCKYHFQCTPEMLFDHVRKNESGYTLF